MFKKKNQTMKGKPVQEKPKPKTIEELPEATPEEVKAAVTAPEEVEAAVAAPELPELPQGSPEEVVEEELTEEQVKQWMRDVAVILNELSTDIARIKHHLRIDFE